MGHGPLPAHAGARGPGRGLAGPVRHGRVLPLPVHEGWVGRKIAELQDTVGCRVAFIMRFGTGVLPEPSSVVQADDEIYIAALSGTITEVTAAAGQAPEESH